MASPSPAMPIPASKGNQMLRQKLNQIIASIRLGDQATARRQIAEVRSDYGVTYGDLQRIGIIFDSRARAWTIAG